MCRSFSWGLLSGFLACACIAAVALRGTGPHDGRIASHHNKFVTGPVGPAFRAKNTPALAAQNGPAAPPGRSTWGLQHASMAAPPAEEDEGTGLALKRVLDRRAAAGLIFAAPAAAVAVSGDAPKQSFFGDQSVSAPFGETYTNRGAGLWQELGETERTIFSRIARDTQFQLQAAEWYAQRSKWADARSTIRLYTYEVRKSMNRLSEGNEIAKKRIEQFKRDIAAADNALVNKDVEGSVSGLRNAIATFESWFLAAGVPPPPEAKVAKKPATTQPPPAPAPATTPEPATTPAPAPTPEPATTPAPAPKATAPPAPETTPAPAPEAAPAAAPAPAAPAGTSAAEAQAVAKTPQVAIAVTAAALAAAAGAALSENAEEAATTIVTTVMTTTTAAPTPTPAPKGGDADGAKDTTPAPAPAPAPETPK